jgi:repressor of nif and glnA expression
VTDDLAPVFLIHFQSFDITNHGLQEAITSKNAEYMNTKSRMRRFDIISSSLRSCVFLAAYSKRIFVIVEEQVTIAAYSNVLPPLSKVIIVDNTCHVGDKWE